jgi:hypothetical protein
MLHFNFFSFKKAKEICSFKRKKCLSSLHQIKDDEVMSRRSMRKK